MSGEHKWQVDLPSDGTRLDINVAEKVSGVSRSRAKTLIESGAVRVDDRIVKKPGHLVRCGQAVAVLIAEPRKLDLTPTKLGLKIVHEDDDLAVIDKPSGLSMHPSSTEHAPTLVHGLLEELKSLSHVGGVERPGIVHRIDKGTSGLVVVSKTDFAHESLAAQFKAHSVDRAYLALVFGDIKKLGRSTGTIETYFGRHPVHRKKMTGKLKSGRKAVTHWKWIESLGSPPALSLVECRLETGRTHQIRAHLSELGFPLVGDPLYGDHAKHTARLSAALNPLRQPLKDLDHQLLHAALLGFAHPRSHERLRFESPLQRDFEEILGLARSLA